MQILESLDYWFWVPVLFWVGLFFWFYRVSYPLYLKKQMKKGKKWAVVLKYRSYWKFLDLVFTLLMAAVSALPAIWVLFRWTGLPWFYGFAISPLFVIVGAVLCRVAKKKAAGLFQSAYFLEYRRAHYESDMKGKMQSEADINNRAIWSFTKKLRNAEAHGCLWKYVNAMAKTKKIPPDVLAEAQYV